MKTVLLEFGRSSCIPRPALGKPRDLQIAETGEEAFEGDGKNPSFGQPVLSDDDKGVQADPVTSTRLGVGGTSDDEHMVVERTAIDEPDEITDAVRRHGM